MFKNYIKIAIRNLRKNKSQSLINIAGLAIGIASVLLIALYVLRELSYERCHKNAGDIYRVAVERQFPNRTVTTAKTPRSLAQALANEYPEVLQATRISREHAARVLVRCQDAKFYEDGLVFADPNIFEVFTLPLVIGNPQTVLQAPFSIVITQKMAQKYFGDNDPIGQRLTLRLLGDGDLFDYTITGVAQDAPENSHFTYDFLAGYQGHPFATTAGKERENFRNLDVYTYLKLIPKTDPATLEAKFPNLVRKFLGPRLERFDGLDFDQYTAAGNSFNYFLQPLKTIHLRSHLSDELAPGGDITYVALFAAIAFIILLLACINFANLATARSATRAREVGVRKMFGSRKSQFIRQFLVETTLLSLVSLALAVGMAELLLPAFSRLSGIAFEFGDLLHWQVLPLLFGLALIVGLLAGIYPAFVLSAYRPAVVLKGLPQKTGRPFLTNSLVVFQFTVSVGLIVGTVIILNQLRFISNKKLGFAAEQVLVVEGTEVLRRQHDAFRDAVLSAPGVIETAHAESMPGRTVEKSVVRLEGASQESQRMLAWMFTGFDFVETLGLKTVAGRSLSRAFPTDSMAVVLNQAAVMELGLTDPIGQRVVWQNYRTYTVVGVVEDFHFASLHQEIEPMMLIGPDPEFENRPRQLVAVRVNTQDMPATLHALGSTWSAFVPQQPFTFTFLDADIDALYHAEKRTGLLFGVFAAIAIFIACLGLFGLSLFAVQKRNKEVSIRKVVGASMRDILFMLTGDFTRWVLLANVFAWPIAWYGMNKWLQNFAYRVDLTIWPFLISGMAALAIALLTVSAQAIRAATANPVEALRYE